MFARFGTQLDENTRQTLERGRRVREVLKQSQSQPLSVAEQIAILLAVNEGVLDTVPIERVGEAETKICQAVSEQVPEICDRIQSGESLTDEDKTALLDVLREVCDSFKSESESKSEH